MFPLSPMNCSIMLPQTLPGPEHILAEIAGNGHSFQMIGFNVIFKLPIFSFLSTQCTTINWLTVDIFVFGLLHHWDNFLIEFLQTPITVICQWNNLSRGKHFFFFCQGLFHGGVGDIFFMLEIVFPALVKAFWKLSLSIKFKASSVLGPINPLSFSSSPTARKDSKSSSKIFASPK